ncbi:hypothetical protein NDK47_17365 [Brevibacillus ruminantium]|uniref:Uncharacterized protein n=1 Tax=Brevibacillus ruminantium TaxID=2950604 RepID=A0ABY4W9S6_9BACL|nr:hypothetical protein [Brevibacillus ruminantium]USG63920.1 hypothetical protein NDK47_17365 [Brevibacillus ruminantium]
MLHKNHPFMQAHKDKSVIMIHQGVSVPSRSGDAGGSAQPVTNAKKSKRSAR